MCVCVSNGNDWFFSAKLFEGKNNFSYAAWDNTASITTTIHVLLNESTLADYRARLKTRSTAVGAGAPWWTKYVLCAERSALKTDQFTDQLVESKVWALYQSPRIHEQSELSLHDLPARQTEIDIFVLTDQRLAAPRGPHDRCAELKWSPHPHRTKVSFRWAYWILLT